MARTPYWQDTLLATVVTTASNVIKDFTPEFDKVATRGLTVVRTIIDISMAPAPPGAVTGTQQVSIGIGVASQEAFAGGVVPDPNVGSERPPRGWIFRTKCMVVDMPEGIPTIVKCVGDFRGKRKVDDGQLFIKIDNDGFQATAFDINVIGIVRTLLLLD